jgi:hypothetical protein
MEACDGLASVSEAAVRLGLLQFSVRAAVQCDYLHPAVVADGQPYFTVAEVERYRQVLGLGAPSPRVVDPMQV